MPGLAITVNKSQRQYGNGLLGLDLSSMFLSYRQLYKTLSRTIHRSKVTIFTLSADSTKNNEVYPEAVL